MQYAIRRLFQLINLVILIYTDIVLDGRLGMINVNEKCYVHILLFPINDIDGSLIRNLKE